jgi:transcription antitermination factor NusG
MDSEGAHDKEVGWMAPQWYVLKSKPNKEDPLYKQVTSRGIEVYYPCRAVRPVNPRARKIVPVFPSYMFVRVDLVEVGLSMFQLMPHAVGLVSFGGEPGVIQGSMMEVLRRNIEAAGKWDASQREDLAPGTALKITNGPFAGYEAIFDTKLPGEERIRILLSVVRGGQISVQLPATYVEKRE